MTKGFAVFALVAGLFAACGGRSFDNGAGAGMSGAASVAGGSSIGGGAGSAGATPSSPCALPKVVGPCDAYMPSFWHDPETGLCVPFVYGGCGGNENRFETREACLTQCPSSESPAGDCQNDSDCTLTYASCCGGCEPVSDTEFLALNVSFVTPIHARQCLIQPPCDPVLCLGATEYDATGKYFKPVCRSGHCTLLDVRQSELTACTADADCVLRDGAGCCQECDGAGIVAVNARADLCGGVPQPCPHCVSRPPPDLKAACSNQHCALALPTR